MVNPELITIEGEEEIRENLLGIGIDEQDVDKLLTGNISEKDVVYFDRKYPELMGVWATAAAAGAKVLKRFGKGFVKIARRIKERRQAKRAAAAAPASTPAPELVKREVARKIDSGKKGINPVIVIVALAGLAAVLILQKK